MLEIVVLVKDFSSQVHYMRKTQDVGEFGSTTDKTSLTAFLQYAALSVTIPLTWLKEMPVSARDLNLIIAWLKVE